jgi:LPXTG-motif cell wall-anchored protein
VSTGPTSATPTTSTAAGAGDLADTGSNTAVLAGLGIGLLIVGAGVLLFARPRSIGRRI